MKLMWKTALVFISVAVALIALWFYDVPDDGLNDEAAQFDEMLADQYGWGLSVFKFIVSSLLALGLSAVLVGVVIMVGCYECLANLQRVRRPARGNAARPAPPRAAQGNGGSGWLSWLLSSYRPHTVTTRFLWDEPATVGSTFSLRCQVKKSDGTPCRLYQADLSRLRCRVKHSGQAVPTVTSIEEGDGGNHALVQFTVNKKGTYEFSVKFGDRGVKEEFVKIFLPGPVSGAKTELVRATPILWCCPSDELTIPVIPKDEFGNVTCPTEHELGLFNLTVVDTLTGRESHQVRYHRIWDERGSRLRLVLVTPSPGVFSLTVTWQDRQLAGDLLVSVVPEKTRQYLRKSFASGGRKQVYYDAKLLRGDGDSKPKSVYIYVTRKHFSVKEFTLYIFSHVICKYKLSTALSFSVSGHGERGMYCVSVTNRGLAAARLVCRDAPAVLAALALNMTSRHASGEQYESFEAKKTAFITALRQHHTGVRGSRVSFTVDRQAFLTSSYTKTKTLSGTDWCKQFIVDYRGEQGIDCGGLYREWYSLMVQDIFSPDKSGLFRRFSEDTTGVVHPSPDRTAEASLKLYKLAGKLVGRSVYRQAEDPAHPALGCRLSHALLAHCVGLTIVPEHLEHDDPELYRSKVRYILQNDPADLELTFTEDEYDSQGRLVRTVELMRGGSTRQVTEDNKEEYVTLLARHRLHGSASRQLDAFREGFLSVVPDSLTDMWSEQDLELLVCGFSALSFDELREHAVVRGSFIGPPARTVEWFWVVVGAMTGEQLARLLQFVTGSSLLPPGGFSALNPPFLVECSFMGRENSLPTAHTCVNQLVLPRYTSLEELRRCLLIAIVEGATGFGLS